MNAVALARGLALLCLSAVSPWAFASSDSGTLTIGVDNVCIKGGGLQGIENLYGFWSGVTGSYSPTGLSEGKSVVSIWDNDRFFTQCGTGNSSLLSISGFSVDPGQEWLSSITCNGVENNGSGAASFFYSGGTATWTWSQVFGLWQKSQVSCTITHS